MVNKKQTIVALFILASILLTLTYLSQTTSHVSDSHALKFSATSNVNISSAQTLSLPKLAALPSLKTSTTPCSSPSGGACQSIITITNPISGGTCGASASLNGGAICIWVCTPQSCQITESIVTMYYASSLTALFSQLDNLLSDLGSSSFQLDSMSSQLSTSASHLSSIPSQLSTFSSQINSGSLSVSSLSSDAQTIFSPIGTAAINMNSQSAQLGDSISSLDSALGITPPTSQLDKSVSSPDSAPGITVSAATANANGPSSKILLSSAHGNQLQIKQESLQASTVQSQINSLIAQINSDESQINAISSQSVASAAGITSANGQLTSISSQLEGAASQINSYNSQISSTASNANSAASTVSSYANHISSIASQLQSVASKLGPSGAGIVQILSDVISFANQITSAVSAFQSSIAQVNDVSTQINSISSQISSYANQINSYTVAMVLANTQINTDISQIQSSTSQAQALGFQIESDASQIQVLESQLGAQGSQQVISQAAQVGTSAANFVSSSTQLGSATSKSSSIQAQINSAVSQINSGTQQIMSVETTINSIASQFSQLGPQLSSESGQINSIANQIGPVIAQIEALISQLSSLSKSSSNASAQHSITPLTSSSGSGFTTSQVLPGTYVISPANSVAAYNYQSAPYYITCPLSPEQNPTDQQYIYTQISPWIVGNECAAGLLTPPLLTIATFTVNFNAVLALLPPVFGQADTNLVKASSSPLKVSNPGTQTENVLTYSPEVDNSISDAFSSQFYIYQHSPSFTAHSIWEWYGNIANFGNAIQPVYLSQYFPVLYWTPSISIVGIPVGACTYSYSYKAKIGFIELANNYIPFNVIVAGNAGTGWGSTSSSEMQFQANVLPYLSYQYALNAPYGQTFQIKESIYNPSTYYTPYNSIDEFPINGTSLFFASYPTSAFSGSFQKSTTSFLEAFQRNGMGVNAITAANVLIMGHPSAVASVPSCTGSACAYFNPVGGCPFARTDQGTDWAQVSSSCNLYAVGSGTVVVNDPGGWGKYGGDIVIKLDHPLPAAYCAGTYAAYESNGGSAFPISSSQFRSVSSCEYVYYAEQITSSVTLNEHVNACQLIGTVSGNNYGIEIGWASPSTLYNTLYYYQTFPTRPSYTVKNTGATPEGTAFYNWIASLSSCSSLGGTPTPPLPTPTPPSSPNPTPSPNPQPGSTPSPQPSGLNVPPQLDVQQNLSDLIYNSSNKQIQQLQQNPNPSVQVLTSPSTTCPNQIYAAGDPTVLSVATADACAQEAGFSGTNLEVAVAIAQAESSLEPGNTNLNGGVCSSGAFAGQPNEDRGIVQINNCAHPDISDSQAFNPTTAFQEMYAISGAGSSFLPWCTYDPGCDPSSTSSGAYCRYMPSGYVGPYCNGGGGISTTGSNPVQTATYTDTPSASAPTFYNLANPISIAATPTDYLYVLNYSPYAPESGGKGGYFINIFRVFPNGRYNMSIYPPNVIGSTSCSNLDTNCNIDKKWAQLWNPYWETTNRIQQNNTVFVKSIDLTALTGGLAGGTYGINNYRVFHPNNISTDAVGDIFISGQNNLACAALGTSGCNTWAHLFNSAVPEVVKISNLVNTGSGAASSSSTPTSSSSSGTNFAVTTNTLFTMPTAATPEIASSPNGAEVFLAGPGNGRIYVLNGNSLSYQGSIDLSFSKNQGQSTTIGVNVMSYFADNGLYNVSIPFLTNPSPNPTSTGYTYFDTGSFHHPLGIQDINGYLYVLDDWQGQSGTIDFAELMYRVINTTGFDVPLNPSLSNDLWKEIQCQQPQATCTENPPPSSSCSPGCVLVAGSSCATYWSDSIGKSYACVPKDIASSSTAPSQLPTTDYINLAAQSSSQFDQNTYPPYGWVLSANITSVNDPTQSVTFCSSYLSPINQKLLPPCTYYPGNMPKKYHGNYLPVGPALVTTGLPDIPGMGYSVNNNGTTTILFPTPPPKPPWWTRFLQSAGCAATLGHFFCPQSTLTQYQELLFVDYSVQNYTNYQTSQGAYKCYISDLSNSKALVTSGCFGSYASNPDPNVVKSNMNALSNMQAPIYTFNDPFKYLISSGSQSMPSYDSSFYTTFSVNALGSGSGVGSGVNYVACANAFSNSMSAGCNGAVNSLVAANEISNYINSNSLSSTGTNINPTQQMLSSEIYGNLLVPYMYKFSIVQHYTNFAFLSLSPEGAIMNAPPFPPGVVLAACESGTAILNTAYGVQNAAQDAVPPTYTTYYYSITKKTSSNRLQVPVQDGSSYLSVYGGSNNKYYQPNLSDQGTIISPQLLYILRTNRQIGNIYINITPWYSMLHGIIPPALLGLSSSQDVLNATVLENYKVTLNMQLLAILSNGLSFSGIIPLGGYETITANDITPQQYGQSAFQNIQCAESSIIAQVLSGGLPCSITSLLPSGLGGATYATANTGFDFTTAINSNHINLFSIYENLSYADNLFLYINGSKYTSGGTSAILSSILGPTSLLGYNRLIYVINDVFNNSIYVPLDADIANITNINMNLNPKISATNPNQTTIYINGTVGYYTDFGTKFVPLANAPIYLYYGADINYVNFNPNSNPANVMLCTYGFGSNSVKLGISASSLPTPQQCQLANPAFTAQLANSDQGTYHPQYYSGNSCAPAANSLLTPLNLKCNIYGTDGNNNIPQTCGTSSVGQQEFCIPIYSNGTGICTSQIGLIGGSTGISSLLIKFDAALKSLSSTYSTLTSAKFGLSGALAELDSFTSSLASSASLATSSAQRLSSMLSAQASLLSKTSSSSSQVSLQVSSLQTEASQLSAIAAAQGSLSPPMQGSYDHSTPTMSQSNANASTLQTRSQLSSSSAQITSLISQITSSTSQISASSSAIQSSLSQLTSASTQANSMLPQATGALSQMAGETSQISSVSSQMASASSQLGPSISQIGSRPSELESIASQLSATTSSV